MREVPLTQGKVALVDDEDYEYVTRWTWYALRNRHSIYAVRRDRTDGKPKLVGMHRQLMQPEPGYVVDHINGDGLDNRRSNLRVATAGQNHANMGMPRKRGDHPSRYKGVYWERTKKRWRAVIFANRKRYGLGEFHTEEEAAMAYNRGAILHHGEFARLNVVEEQTT